jgi:hypothetical protein
MREARQTRERLARDMAEQNLKAYGGGQGVFEREDVLQILATVHDTWAESAVKKEAAVRGAGFVYGVAFAALLFAFVFWVTR